MSKKVEFHYDFASPNSYLSHRVIPGIEKRTGARFIYVPILLGGVFKATNNRSPMDQFAEVKNKKEYHSKETERFIKKHNIDKYCRNPHFPVNTLHIMRGACYCLGKDFESDYIEAMFQCMWERGLNMNDPTVIGDVLREYELPASEIVAGTQDPAVKKILIDQTSSSVAKGNFGSPTFFVGNEMFFGKDRLGEVEEEILNNK